MQVYRWQSRKATAKKFLKALFLLYLFEKGDYNLGYICLSEGVHVRLLLEGKNILIYLYRIFVHISVHIILNNHYMLC